MLSNVQNNSMDSYEFSDGTRIILRPYFKKKYGGYRNLQKIRNNEVLWRAELPQGSAQDAYVSFEVYSEKIIANSFGGYKCEICLETGKVLAENFVK